MNRYERWAKEFGAALTEADLTAAEFTRRYRSLGGDAADLTDGTVSKWRNPVHRLAPSPKAAARAAAVLRQPVSRMMRAASHDEVADIIEEYENRLATAPDATRNLPLDRLRGAGIDPKIARRIADDYLRDIDSATRRLDLEIEAARQRPGKSAGAKAQAATADRWLAWLTQSVAGTALAIGRDIAAEDLTTLSEGTIGAAEIKSWKKAPATPTAARLVAVTLADLRRSHGIIVEPEEFLADTVTALRAAGHDDVAEFWAQAQAAEADQDREPNGRTA